ncbi:UDP-N-acetylmuramoyl-L-alanine--D-glutamate ligase [Actinospongicola halichondriae]|uniref:UDP-N-acetylmuramoyl-L-alanine--D-glutamate ligase n=1 Tax=Actinospongicola halichondriae TaxID=3236844 RepID=UPI003D4381F6
MTTRSPLVVPETVLVVGFGLANRAVARALLSRGHTVSVTDDRPTDATRVAAESAGVTLIEAPDTTALARLVDLADAVVPAPGLPDRHPVFALAEDHGTPVLTEFDLAAAWDDRPIVAITGTDGKTTVTTMVTAMLNEAGIACIDAGNNDLPLVSAIEDPAPCWFVVEASSFRLGRTHGWAPRVGTWLNLAPDHLDVHATHADYEAAKARIWSSQGPDDVAIGNLDDEVVARRLASAPGRRVGFSTTDPEAPFSIVDGALMGPGGVVLPVAELPRQLPHDLSNALAAAATASAAGADDESVARVLRRSLPLPHRVEPVATVDDVTYYDDSKATVPHATIAALAGFDSVVLIAGGRNKGLDLTPLASAADRIRAVVAIGDAAVEIVAAFDGIRPVEQAGDMATAVASAARLARPGDAVLLSPACASFDWYPDYAARGDDFAAHVLARKAHT